MGRELVKIQSDRKLYVDYDKLWINTLNPKAEKVYISLGMSAKDV